MISVMPRLLDCSEATATSVLGGWLDSILDGPLQTFRVQAGYADRKSFNYLCARLRDTNVELVRLVLGGNQASLTADAALAALAAVSIGGEAGGLRVVSFSNGLFHPKTVHVRRADGSMAAYVGSANFTEAGLSGRNAEAGVLFDSRDGDPEQMIQAVEAATDAWFCDPMPQGVEVVRTQVDVVALTERGILRAEDTTTSRDRDSTTPKSARGPVRRPAWTTGQRSTSQGRVGASADAGAPVLWWKKLSASDAQRPPNPNTNPTGKLRLTKSRLGIDPKTFFRDELFGDLPWRLEQRGSNVYECTTVQFTVAVLGRDEGHFDLHVDHAPHRIADQDNIPTVLAWGSLGEQLRQRDCTGKFIVIERDEVGRFSLTIQDEPPTA